MEGALSAEPKEMHASRANAAVADLAFTYREADLAGQPSDALLIEGVVDEKTLRMARE